MDFLTLVTQNNIKAVQNFLENGTSQAINAHNKNGNNALYIASSRGHSVVVQLLLDSDRVTDQTINAHNNNGNNALYIASSQGHSAIVEILLDSNRFTDQTINAHNKDGNNALHIAVSQGHSAIVEILLDSDRVTDQTINAYNKDGNNALHMAVSQGHSTIVEILLGSDRVTDQTINAHNNKGNNALHMAVSQGHSVIVEILLDSDRVTDQTINAFNLNENNDWTALHLAVGAGHIMIVEILLNSERFTDQTINSRNKNGITVLHVATNTKKRDITALLLDSDRLTDQTINSQDNDGWTALHHAIQKDGAEVVKVLLNSDRLTDQTINAENLNGRTVFGLAVLFNYPVIVELLLNSDRLTDQTINDENIFDVAIKEGYADIMELLLNSPRLSAQIINAHDEVGNNALHLAIMEKQPTIVEILLSSDRLTDQSINAANSNGFNVLRLALYYKLTNIIKILLDSGRLTNQTINAPNIFKVTVLCDAISKGEFDMAQLLYKYGAEFPNPKIEVVLINLVENSGHNVNQLAKKYGVLIPGNHDALDFFTKEIWFHYPKILDRDEPYPPPPPIDREIPLDYYQEILSYYTLQELDDAYELQEVQFNRRLVINNIYENFDRLIWSTRHRHCNNDDTLNIMQGELHGQVDKNDDDNPTYSYGRTGNYRCYQQDELEAAWDPTRDPEHFNFVVPDWSPPVDDRPMIDPTTNQPLSRYFPVESIRPFTKILSRDNERPLRTTIEQGLELIEERDGLIAQARQQYQAMTETDQQSVELYLTWFFLFGMWMRFWKGPGHPWPIKTQAGPEVCEPPVRDQHIIIQLVVREEILDNINPDLRRWLLDLPMIQQKAVGSTGSLQKYLEEIQAGQYCMGYGADTIIQASQKLIKSILDQPVNQLIQAEWTRLIELERRVVSRLRHNVTQRSDPIFVAELNQRAAELQNKVALPAEIPLTEIGFTRHT